MNRDTLIALIDHGKTAVVYVGFGLALIVAAFLENERAITIFSSMMAGGGLVQGASAAASSLKRGQR